ncbi:uncharacterized protein LOC108901666 [Lates calcarifer]|uniref:Uncharacterized protein LOC108901666 n=1 Tax=Lates calcarifer TaxID=8187 RepID=A0AAJ7QKP0_LATCA|nr:uncharacterized protein LOC108901666 [Lates calcarifer]
MPSHIMLSYQWDDQALVKKIYNRLKDDGLPVWMDIEGGVTGNINDAMAAGVEEAVVICPFMTMAYQASRSCKKELNYADSREVIIVPVMVEKNWDASEWLGLITAGLLWVDFRNAENDEEHFEMCLRSLEEEIMFNAGHLLAVEEPPREEVDEPEPSKRCPKRKPGRGFRHAFSDLYIHDSGEQIIHAASDSRNTVELSETPGDHCYWEEIKGNGCKYYRNVVTNRYLGKHRDSCSLNKGNMYVKNVVFIIKWSKINLTLQARKKGNVCFQVYTTFKFLLTRYKTTFLTYSSFPLQGLTKAVTRSTLRPVPLCLKSGCFWWTRQTRVIRELSSSRTNTQGGSWLSKMATSLD